jgi:hypothetical protein
MMPYWVLRSRSVIIADADPMPRMSRVAPAHCCAAAPSEPDLRLSPHLGSSKPRWLAGWQKCGPGTVSGEGSSLTVRVCETDSKSVRRAVVPVDDVLLGYRFPGRGQPLFPLAWASWLILGVQQETSAVWAAAALRLQ